MSKRVQLDREQLRRLDEESLIELILVYTSGPVESQTESSVGKTF